MMHTFKIVAILPFVLSSGALAATVSSTAAQTFVGMGGSGAWWPLDIYNFPEAQKRNLSNLLFGQTGLQLGNYRWNIGGGGVGVSNPSRAPQTQYVSPGVYNWSADPQGVYFMQAASSAGSVITGFVNSAPAPLTSTNQSCGGEFVAGTGAAYGTYVADVLQHWIDDGVNIKYISPMNEPDNSFGPVPCDQEGMEVVPSNRAEVVSGLYNALSARGLTSRVGIIADETTSVSLATTESTVWVPSVKSQVVALAHHTYDYPSNGAYQTYVNETKADWGLGTWMTEICCSLGEADGTGKGWSQGYDPTIANALMFSGMVFQSLVFAGEARYDWWTLASNAIGCSPLNNASCYAEPNSSGWTDGLVYYDPDYATNENYQFYLTKHYWTYKHFTNSVKAGMQRLPVSSPTSSDTVSLANVLVASSATQYHIIVMNTNTTSAVLTLVFPAEACASTAFRTSATEDFSTIANPILNNDGKTWKFTLTSTSLSSFVLNKC